jgi:hypothetical protein
MEKIQDVMNKNKVFLLQGLEEVVWAREGWKVGDCAWIMSHRLSVETRREKTQRSLEDPVNSINGRKSLGADSG